MTKKISRDSLSRHVGQYTPSRIPSVWRDLLQIIPHYDPLAHADAFVFDAEEATHRISFFDECIKHVKGEKAGQPYSLVPHEASIVANIFGWKNAQGLRRYREFLYFVPRKNSKTTFTAGLGMCVLFCDEEPSKEIYSTAFERQQAAIIFDIASQMIDLEPEMANRCKVLGSYKSIETGAHDIFRALSNEASGKHGYNVHCAINDEIHTHGEKSDIITVMRTAMGARRQPLMGHLTTSDYDRPSFCNTLYDYAKRVQQDPSIDLAFLPVIYELDREKADTLVANDDGEQVPYWTTPEAAREANPMYDHISTIPSFIAREVSTALQQPSYENMVKRLHFNIRTQQSTRWLSMTDWDFCTDDNPAEWRREAMERNKGRRCWGGLDLGATSDLTAMVLLFDSVDGGFDVIPYCWVPRDSVHARVERDMVPYDVWIRQGFIIETPGDVTDYDRVRADINSLAKEYKIELLNVDAAFQGMQLCTQLYDEDSLPVETFRQGIISYAAPSRRFEELVISKKLYHGGNPVLRWQAAHVAVVEAEGGLIKPSKKHSAEKIDLIVASIMGLAARMKLGDQKRSVYEDRGPLIF